MSHGWEGGWRADQETHPWAGMSPSRPIIFVSFFVCLFEWGGGWLLQSLYIVVSLNHKGQQEVMRNGEVPFIRSLIRPFKLFAF